MIKLEPKAKKEQITLVLTRAQKEQLLKSSEKSGLSQSHIVGQLIEKGLK